MPTLTVETSPLTGPERRRIASRLTRWFADRGVSPTHVVTRFVDLPPGSLYSGALPVEALAREDAAISAMVTCCVAPERDTSFLADLADEIAGALGVTTNGPFLSVEFRPTSSAHVYVWRDNKMRRTETLRKGHPHE